MAVLFKNVSICDPQSPHHGKTLDVLMSEGIYHAIGKDLEEQEQTIDGTGMILTPGWFDLHVNFNDPGNEHREDLQSGAAAAANGGFTDVLLSSNTEPVTDSKSQIQYIKSKGNETVVKLWPSAALSEGGRGKEISEMFDMLQAGAVAFSDDKNIINNPDLLKRALLYTKDFGRPVMVRAEDADIANKGQMNEGPQSTSLGMKGRPALAEELMIARDLYLAEYCEAAIHFSTISTKKSVEMIAEAQRNGLKVTADVAMHNLVWTEDQLEGFESNFKLNPPLRSEEDRLALLQGVKNGVIAAITSDHVPLEIERKDCEFELADFGISGLETFYAQYNQHLADHLDLDTFVKAVTAGPREVLGLESQSIKEGNMACLTLIDPSAEWVASHKNWKSKSKNNPLFGQLLKGRVKAVLSGCQMKVNY